MEVEEIMQTIVHGDGGVVLALGQTSPASGAIYSIASLAMGEWSVADLVL